MMDAPQCSKSTRMKASLPPGQLLVYTSDSPLQPPVFAHISPMAGARQSGRDAIESPPAIHSLAVMGRRHIPLHAIALEKESGSGGLSSETPEELPLASLNSSSSKTSEEGLSLTGLSNSMSDQMMEQATFP